MKTLLRWLLVVLGVVAGVLLAVTAYGLVLSREHAFSRDVYIAASPEKVWAVASDFASEPQWLPGLRQIERLPDRHGRPAWRITDEHGVDMTMVVEQSDAPHRLVRQYADASGSFSGRWTMELWPEGSGCRVKLAETGHYENAFFRGVAHLVLGQDKFVNDYLAALRQRVESGTK